MQVTDSLSGDILCDVGTTNCQTGLGRFNVTDTDTGQTQEFLVCEGINDYRHYVDQIVDLDAEWNLGQPSNLSHEVGLDSHDQVLGLTRHVEIVVKIILIILKPAGRKYLIRNTATVVKFTDIMQISLFREAW